jgi:hypothetical protein
MTQAVKNVSPTIPSLNKALFVPVIQNKAVKTAQRMVSTPQTPSENLSRFLEASCDCC